MDYPAKFARIAEKTSFRLLDADAQAFLGDMAKRYRFTLQELQLVSDMALDRLRWKEASLQADWPPTGDKGALIRALRRRHGQIRDGEKGYAAFSAADRPQTVKPEIRVASKPRLGLGRCPVASEKTRCCNLLTLDAVEKCGFDCSYCSIQSFYHGNAVTFDGTFPEKLAALRLDPDETYHIGTGQSSDSLMWGNHNGVLEALTRFARDNPNVLLEFKTKSRNIGWLLENGYPPNVLTTWSLNPQTIIDHEEHLSASLAQRLDAAERIAAGGRLVGFHFHPIVRYDRWREEYGAICREIVARFEPRQVAMVSLGTLTFTRSVMKTIRRRPLASKILQMPMVETAGKYSYPSAVKTELFRHVYEALSPWHDRVFFYLCMEPQALWEPVFGHAFADNEAFERAMKQSYITKVRALD